MNKTSKRECLFPMFSFGPIPDVAGRSRSRVEFKLAFRTPYQVFEPVPASSLEFPDDGPLREHWRGFNGVTSPLVVVTMYDYVWELAHRPR